MKHKIWLFQIPFVALFTFAFWVETAGVNGELKNEFLRTKVFKTVRTISGLFTNAKFHTRGPMPPRNKIVVVEIDSPSIETLGRWPWHRDLTAMVIDKSFEAGAKVVGLDITFSEPDQRVPEDLAKILVANKLGGIVQSFETDYALKEIIEKHKDRLVLGWMTDSTCQPAYDLKEECPVSDPEYLATHQPGFDKFAFDTISAKSPFDVNRTAMRSAFALIANIPLYGDAAKYSGYLNVEPDPDGYIRRINLAMAVNKHIYPSLALGMAKIGLGEKLEIDLDDRHNVERILLANSGKVIPTSPLGVMEVNFRGAYRTFQYVSAMDLLREEDKIQIMGPDRKIAEISKSSILKDAYVFVGLTAVGVFDMRAFPFDSNTAGVEGHANILDNILSGDMLTQGSKNMRIWMFLLMTVGALLFAISAERLEAIPALLLAILTLGGFAWSDVKFLFENNINWNTSLLYIEFTVIFITTLAIKYVKEERNKKFIKGAFAKYVSPALLDSIMEDPSKLTLGGEKRELSILFSDIRGFTTFSERMDAKALAHFLNDYLGIMTDIVFDCEGTLDKYIGDAVMAFWGAPLNQPKHAANACKAAVRMMKALHENKPRFKSQYGVDVNVGIGVNSGPVNVGNMGSERIFEYTVIGDHVNLASRVESLTKFYSVGIITTRFTLEMIQSGGEPPPAHRIIDFVKVKGKKTAVELIQIFDKDLSPEGLKLFEEGRALYAKQQWDQAIECFRKAAELLRQGPDEPDGPTDMYIERCKEFKLKPPNADWDGSWEMHSK